MRAERDAPTNAETIFKDERCVPTPTQNIRLSFKRDEKKHEQEKKIKGATIIRVLIERGRRKGCREEEEEGRKEGRPRSSFHADHTAKLTNKPSAMVVGRRRRVEIESSRCERYKERKDEGSERANIVHTKKKEVYMKKKKRGNYS